MATESRVPRAGLGAAALEESLRNDPQSFSYFQAIRLLQRLRPRARNVGGFAPPEQEVARLSVNPSLAFAAGEIQEMDLDAEGPAEVEVNFMGLVGSMGVLPYHYSLLVSDEAKRHKRPLTDFLNIFQHRILSLFYRAWERARFYVPFERGEEDLVSRHALDLIGLGRDRVRGRMPVPDHALLFYSGLLGLQRRGAAGLQQILEDFFQVPVEVQQFVGAWYPLARSSQCRVDDEPPAGAVGLGHGTVVGDEIWDPQARARIRVGPLSREQYDAFLPGGGAERALKAITGFYGDGQFDFEVRLVLARDDVPGVVLGEAEGTIAALGWSTWIRTGPFGRDADDATLTL